MCGLTGYCGKSIPDIAKIKLTSIFIRERGKDAVGFLLNNSVTRGVWEGATKDNGDPLSFFFNWYFPSANSKKLKSNTVIVHNRSSTRGAKTVANSHPFVYEKDGHTYFFAKNGTLTYSSEIDLCKEYELNKNDFDVDSKLLGHIIVHHGWDVLTKYVGGAAFVLYSTKEPNTIYLFKGQSLENGKLVEERPLHYYKTKNGLYFSSTVGSLVSAHDVSEEEIESFEPNHLYKIVDGEIVEKTFYDRTKVESKSTTTYNTDDYYGTGAKSNYHNNAYHNNFFSIVKKSKTDEEEVYYNVSLKEKSPFKMKHVSGNRICFYQGIYWANGHPANGCFLLDETGKIKGKKDNGNDDGFTHYYFYKGLLVKNAAAINELSKIFTKTSKLFENPELMEEVRQYLHEENTLFFFSYSKVRTAHKIYCYRGSEKIASNYWTVTPKFCPYKYSINIILDKYQIELNEANYLKMTDAFSDSNNDIYDNWDPMTIIGASKTVVDLFNENFKMQMSSGELSSSEKSQFEMLIRKVRLIEKSTTSAVEQIFGDNDLKIDINTDFVKAIFVIDYILKHPTYAGLVFTEIEDEFYANLT